MENCLVTKLKSEVNNNNLERFDKIHLRLVPAPSPRRWVVKNITQNFKVEGNGAIALSVAELETDPKTELTVTAGNSEVNVYFSNTTTYDVYISNKSNLTYYNSNVVNNIEDVEWCLGLTYISADWGYMTGNIRALSKLTELRTISIAINDLEGNLSSLSELTKVTSIDFTRNTPGNLTGNIASLAKLTSLTNISFFNAGTFTGSYDEFVYGQVDNGRASARIKIHALPIYKFFDTTLPNVTMGYLEWNTKAKIIIYATLSNQDDYTTASRIFAYGATAEEIAAWEQAGKTVVIVSQ